MYIQHIKHYFQVNLAVYYTEKSFSFEFMKKVINFQKSYPKVSQISKLKTVCQQKALMRQKRRKKPKNVRM